MNVVASFHSSFPTPFNKDPLSLKRRAVKHVKTWKSLRWTNSLTVKTRRLTESIYLISETIEPAEKRWKKVL